MVYISILVLLAGIAIATQAGMNVWLGQILKNPLMATSVAFASSLVFSLIALVVSGKGLPSAEAVRSTPPYLWFAGGILSAFGIASVYWTMPKLGIGRTMSLLLAGQLLFSVVAARGGWFHLPVAPITPIKALGIVLMLVSIPLINSV